MYYVYILRLSNNKYYIGFTSDKEKRLEEHQNGGVTSTKNYRPLERVYYRIYENKEKALIVERYLKKMKSRKMIERFIQGGKLKIES